MHKTLSIAHRGFTKEFLDNTLKLFMPQLNRELTVSNVTFMRPPTTTL